MKKLQTLAVAAALMALTATPAFADDHSESESPAFSRSQIISLIEMLQNGQLDAAQEFARQIDLADLQERQEERETRQAERELRKANRQAAKAALEANDFDTWTELVPEDAPFTADRDTFESLQEAHELKEAGDKEGARAIFDELGIEKPQKKHGKHRGGFGKFRGFDSQN